MGCSAQNSESTTDLGLEINYFFVRPEQAASPVSIQIMMVSINGSKIETIPSETGSLALAAACAIGAEPCPASFEKSPRLTPRLKANEMVAPRNPPVAAEPVKRSLPTAASEGIYFSINKDNGHQPPMN